MSDEFFYGVTLKGESAETIWNPESNEAVDYPRVNKLIVKQILLGVEAAENEYNVIEVETKSEEKTVKIPIAVLKVGEIRCSQSFLEFPDAPVTFRLIKGKGPVHIHGHHLVGMDTDDNLEEELEDEEIDEEDDETEESIEPSKKKPKLASNNKGGAKNNEKNSKK